MNKENAKEKIVLFIGIVSLLMSLLFIKDDFEIFLFFFIVFSICLLYSRKLVINILGKSIIKDIRKLNNEKGKLQKDVNILNVRCEKMLKDISEKQETIMQINKYNEIINKLNSEKNSLKTDVANLENKKRNIISLLEQEKNFRYKIDEEKRNIETLLKERQKLENEKDNLETEKDKLLQDVDKLKRKINPIKKQKDFMQYCKLENIDSLKGKDFEKFCVKLLEIDGYTEVKNTPISGDYGIDIIAEKDGIKYAIQCKRYEGKVGNDAIQEAIAGKEFYNCNIGIVLTNSDFTKNAKVLAKSVGIVLWNRDTLIDIIKRNIERLL